MVDPYRHFDAAEEKGICRIVPFIGIVSCTFGNLGNLDDAHAESFVCRQTSVAEAHFSSRNSVCMDQRLLPDFCKGLGRKMANALSADSHSCLGGVCDFALFGRCFFICRQKQHE